MTNYLLSYLFVRIILTLLTLLSLTACGGAVGIHNDNRSETSSVTASISVSSVATSSSESSSAQCESYDCIAPIQDVDVSKGQMTFSYFPLGNAKGLKLTQTLSEGELSAARKRNIFDFIINSDTGEMKVTNFLYSDFSYSVLSSQGTVNFHFHNAPTIRGKVTNGTRPDKSDYGVSAISQASYQPTDSSYFVLGDAPIPAAITDAEGDFIFKWSEDPFNYLNVINIDGLQDPVNAVTTLADFHFDVDAATQNQFFSRSFSLQDLRDLVDSNGVIDLTKNPDFFITPVTTLFSQAGMNSKNDLVKAAALKWMTDGLLTNNKPTWQSNKTFYSPSDWESDSNINRPGRYIFDATDLWAMMSGTNKSIFEKYVASLNQFALHKPLDIDYWGDAFTLIDADELNHAPGIFVSPESVLGWINSIHFEQDGTGTLSSSGGNISFTWASTDGVTKLIPTRVLQRPNIARKIVDPIELRLMGRTDKTDYILLTGFEQTVATPSVKTAFNYYITFQRATTATVNPILEADVIFGESYYISMDALSSSAKHITRSASVITFNADHTFTGEVTYDGEGTASNKTWSVANGVLSLQFTLSGASILGFNGNYRLDYHATKNSKFYEQNDFFVDASTPIDTQLHFLSTIAATVGLLPMSGTQGFTISKCNKYFDVELQYCEEIKTNQYNKTISQIVNQASWRNFYDANGNGLIEAGENQQIIDGTWTVDDVTKSVILTGYYDGVLRQSCIYGSSVDCLRKDLVVRVIGSIYYLEERDYDVLGIHFVVSRTTLTKL